MTNWYTNDKEPPFGVRLHLTNGETEVTWSGKRWAPVEYAHDGQMYDAWPPDCDGPWWPIDDPPPPKCLGCGEYGHLVCEKYEVPLPEQKRVHWPSIFLGALLATITMGVAFGFYGLGRLFGWW